MTTPLSNAYMRFLQLTRVLSEDADIQLSANHRALLEAVALAWHCGSPMSVRQAIGLSDLGSPATLHKRLAVLRAQGYVEEIAVAGDRRTKLLGLTQKAVDYFDKLGAALIIPQS